MLDRVTITGADDSVKPLDLYDLSCEFPFVEWGILASGKRTDPIAGTPRFPCKAWIASLQDMAAGSGGKIKLSLHLCGQFVRDLLMGKTEKVPHWFSGPQFQRWQLNFHGEDHDFMIGPFLDALMTMCDRKQVIFQIDGHLGHQFLADAHQDAKGAPFECVPLFDVSHGAGVVPGEWPAPFDIDTYHGYAGGLGPDNLAEQIPLITKAANGCRFWIDMETKVRSDDDVVFDLAKVRKCLEIAKQFVKVPA